MFYRLGKKLLKNLRVGAISKSVSTPGSGPGILSFLFVFVFNFNRLSINKYQTLQFCSILSNTTIIIFNFYYVLLLLLFVF